MHFIVVIFGEKGLGYEISNIFSNFHEWPNKKLFLWISLVRASGNFDQEWMVDKCNVSNFLLNRPIKAQFYRRFHIKLVLI